jgi:beta-glucosidase
MSRPEDDTSSTTTMSDSPDSQINDPIFDKFAEDSEDRSSGDTNTTPNSDFSPPDSPTSKNAALSKTDDKRAKARSLAASLSLEEQVRNFPRSWYR